MFQQPATEFSAQMEYLLVLGKAINMRARCIISFEFNVETFISSNSLSVGHLELERTIHAMSPPVKTSALSIPESPVTITTRIIDIVTIALSSTSNLYSPDIEGVERTRPAPSLSFLLEHPSGRKLLFDLGIPKNIDALGPEVSERLRRVGHKVLVEKDVVELLEENEISRNDIEAVVWR